MLPLDKRGRIVARQGDGYRVALGGLTVTCAERDLRAPERARGRQKPERTARRVTPRTHSQATPLVRTLDLHGMRVEEAREAVIACLDRALLDGFDRVEVIHGIGTGRVKAAALEQIRRIGTVRHVRPHPRNPGVTIVEL